MPLDTTVGFLGAGNMGEALLRGLVAKSVVAPSRLFASDPRAEHLATLAKDLGFTAATNEVVAAASGIVVVAVKPDVVPALLAEVAPHLRPGTLVVSIAAGVTSRALQDALPGSVHVVRAMPNTPALVGEGVTALAAAPGATPEDLAKVAELFAAVGSVVTVDEKQLDVVTGLSGSGPAYVMLVIEALADGGVRMGLPRSVALQLATQTVLGSARLAAETREHPALLREKVTSPGGTTAAGLHALERHGTRAAFTDAVVAATERARELSKKS